MLVDEMTAQECDTCGKDFPHNKFNEDSFSPGTCFKCRVSGTRFGFAGGKTLFHGDSLVGGTIASDNRNTVALARANGHDPVPAHTAGGVGVTSKELDKLKNVSGFSGTSEPKRLTGITI